MSSLFDDFYSSLCNGANEMVPIIHHSMGKAEWEAVARIIAYGSDSAISL